jgi:hypothetical protein
MKKITFVLIISSLLLYMISIIYSMKWPSNNNGNAQSTPHVTYIPYSQANVIDKYISLISKMDLPQGGYSVQPVQHQYGTLYSTSYILNTLKLLDYNVQKETLKNLESFSNTEISKIVNKDNTNLVYDLFYYAEIQDLLGIQNRSSDNVAIALNMLEEEDGSYYSNIREKSNKLVAEEDRIPSMYRALFVKKALGLSISQANIDWVNKQYNKVIETSTELGLLLNLLKSMELLGLDYDKEQLLSKSMHEIAKKMEESNTVLEAADALELAKMLGFNISPTESFWKKIASRQNEDGAWSYDFGPFSEEQGTYIVVNTYHQFNREIPNKVVLLNTLLEQNSFFGGYSSMYQSDLDLNSTYYIVYLNNLFHIKLKNIEKTNEVLKRRYKDLKNLTSHEKYRLLFLKRMLGSNELLPQNLIFAEWVTEKANIIDTNNILDVYFYCLSSKELGSIINHDEIERQINSFYNLLLSEQVTNANIGTVLLTLNTLIMFQDELDGEKSIAMLGSYIDQISEILKNEPFGIFLLKNIMDLIQVDMSGNPTYAIINTMLNDAITRLQDKLASSSAPLQLADLYYYERIRGK